MARIVIAANITFWFLRKTENGLAMSMHSWAGSTAPPAEDALTARAYDDYPNITGFAGATQSNPIIRIIRAVNSRQPPTKIRFGPIDGRRRRTLKNSAS